MTNPFDDDSISHTVIINSEGQFSLWPEAIGIPSGWTVVHEADSRENCLEYIEAHWVDMRPNRSTN